MAYRGLPSVQGVTKCWEFHQKRLTLPRPGGAEDEGSMQLRFELASVNTELKGQLSADNISYRS
jgi:hypothetical protein